MLPWFADLALAVYAVAALFLAVQGLHSLWLLARFLARRRQVAAAPPVAGPLPTVLVQLPVFNERDVVERLVAAVGALAWPADRLRIQLLDDGDDDSVARGARAIAALRARGLDAVHLRRGERTGFKAGALAHGLRCDDAAAGGPAAYVAIFDADFVPAPDFLQRTVPALAADAGAAFVQARWEHLDALASPLTAAQALGIDGHFAVEQAARAWSGLPLNFNGTCGVWRRAAIDDSGGWQLDTLTEDLDLSYRARLRGWRGRFLVDVAVPGELPPTLEAWRAQQFRWAKGSLQTAKKLLPALWRAPLPLVEKAAATLHLTHYLVHPAILASLLAAPLAAVALRELPMLALVFGVGLLLAGLAPPLLLYVAAQRALGRPASRLLALPALMSLGTGLAWSNTRAAWQALVGERSPFERTPKHGGGRGSYRATPAAGLGELAVFAVGAAGVGSVYAGRTWWLMPAVAVYVLGFLLHGAWLLRNRLAEAFAADQRPARPAWPLVGAGGVAVAAAAGLGLLARSGGSWRTQPLAFAGLALAIGAACWVADRHAQRARGSFGQLAWIGAVAVALLAAASALPPSDDVQRYLVEGLQGLAGQNPYAIAPAAAGLPGVDAAGVNHAAMTSIYPPLMLHAHTAVAALAPTPAGFRALALGAAVALVVAALGLLCVRGRPPARVVAVAWHPVLALFAVGEAHHDVVAAAALAVALLLVAGGRGRAAVLATAAAALLKPFAVVALPFVLQATAWRHAWLAVAAAVAAYAPFTAAGAGLFASLRTYAGSMQFHAPLEPLLRDAALLLAPYHVAVLVVRGLLVAVALGGGVWLWRRSAGAPVEARCARAVALVLLCLPTLHPWYFTALVPLLPFVRSGALLAWTCASGVYWLHGAAMPVGAPWAESRWVTAAAHLPFVAWLLAEAALPALRRRRTPTPAATCVVVLAKAPVRGTVKTRLAAAVGDDEALAVYQQLLARTAAALAPWPGPVVVLTAGDRSAFGDGYWRRLPGGPQPAGPLGTRIAAALRAGLARAPVAVVVGTDCPGLGVRELAAVAALAGEGRVGLGPCPDGGFWAIAAASPAAAAAIERGSIPWSSADTLAATTARLGEAGFAVAHGPTLADVDHEDDLATAVAAGLLSPALPTDA